MAKKRYILSALLCVLTAQVVAPQGAAALAAEQKRGWQQEEDGRWIYLDRTGAKLTDTWVKENGKDCYYLDEDGYMAVDTIIKGDDIYYVDENGRRARNCWASESNADQICDMEVETLWYYFDKDGRARREEGKGLKLKKDGVERRYFFDSDGHMLSGWQEVNGDIYYFGTEDQGFARLQWQYLEPSEDMISDRDKDYDSLEMFYFGYDGKMSRNSDSTLGGKHFFFDQNGVMVKGWYPGISPADGADPADFDMNMYYDETTGERASGWIYAYDPDDDGKDGDPHWFYCDKNKGTVFNIGGKDSDDQVGAKRIDGHTYFFDDKGHMVYGLISTDGTALKSAFMEDDYADLSGDIGKAGGMWREAGIYYLSAEESTLGQLQSDRVLKLDDGYETEYYYLSGSGKAYTNALVKGCIYGEDGSRICSDSGWEIVSIDRDIYKEKDSLTAASRAAATPVIPSGSQAAVNKAGRVRKDGKVTVDGATYVIEDYVIVSGE